MKAMRPLLSLLLVAFLSGCAAFQTGSEVLHGRQAFLIGNHEAALAYFKSAAQKDPDYVYGTALRQGILSYVGRAEYATGNCRQAQQTLERALNANKEEDVARLYLGLSLACTGDRQRALQEIADGMKGIHDWLEYITQAHRFSFGQWWDPRGEIRSTIKTDLALLSARDADIQKLITDGEWIGKQIEEEGDKARRDEAREWGRDSDGRGDSQP